MSRPTIYLDWRWTGADSAWEQEKPEARKMIDAKCAAREVP
jgi:hypothetical protein